MGEYRPWPDCQDLSSLPEKTAVAQPVKSQMVAKPVVIKPQITKEYVNS